MGKLADLDEEIRAIANTIRELNTLDSRCGRWGWNNGGWIAESVRFLRDAKRELEIKGNEVWEEGGGLKFSG